MAGNIGIKQANGEFYSILDEGSAVKKRIILSTVHDNQKSAQIDLYRSATNNMNDAMYIGSLVVENIVQKPKGEPSIEMILSSTDDSVTAVAVDLANPENKHHLSISLKSLEEDKEEYPDFDIDIETEQKRKFKPLGFLRKIPWFAIVIIGLVLVLLCLGLLFFLFSGKKDAKQAAVWQIPALFTGVEQDQPIIVETPPEPGSQHLVRARTWGPAYSYNVPETIPPEGIVFTTRLGDTLWDISEAFYRNPRHYLFIVRSNGIRDPNNIAPGTEITILPRI